MCKLLPDESGTTRRVELRTAEDKIVPRAVDKLVHLFETGESDDESEEESTDTETPGIDEPDNECLAKATAPEVTETETKSKDAKATPCSPAPKLRRSPRNAKNIALLTQAVLCWLTFSHKAPKTEAMPHHPRNYGQIFSNDIPNNASFTLSTLQIRDVYLQTTEFMFELTTNINVTADLAAMQTETDNFLAFCQANADHNPLNVTDHCLHAHRNVAWEMATLRDEILAQYPGQRTTRSMPYAAFNAASRLLPKTLAKQLPNVLLIGSIGYGLVDNYRTRAQVDELRSRITKLAELSLELGDLDREHLDNSLDHLLSIQRLQALESGIIDFTTDLQVFLQSIAAKHRSITVRPLSDELWSNLQALNASFSDNLIPSITRKDFLSICDTAKFARDDMVIITYTFPLVASQMVQEKEVHATLKGSLHIGKILVYFKTSAWATSSPAAEIENDIVKQAIWSPISDCLGLVLKTNTSHGCEPEDLMFFATILEHSTSRGEGYFVSNESSTGPETHEVRGIRVNDLPGETENLMRRDKIRASIMQVAKNDQRNIPLPDNQFFLWLSIAVCIAVRCYHSSSRQKMDHAQNGFRRAF